MSLRTRLHACLLPAALLTLATLPAPEARADGGAPVACTVIDRLPYTITVGGDYCLTRNLATAQPSGAAITIAANNVTLDCGHRRISGRLAGDGSTATGIFASRVTALTVRHCGIRGFQRGLWVMEGSFAVIEGNRLDQNLRVGLDVDAYGSTIRGNTIFDTGGGTAPPLSTPFAINAVKDTDVLDNLISEVHAPPGSGLGVMGIYVNDGDGAVVAHNRIRHLQPDGGAGAYAVLTGGNDTRVFIHDNMINMARSGTTVGAVHCPGPQSVAFRNVLLGMGEGADAITGCDAFDNRVR